MHDPKDIECTKVLRREFNKRHFDTSLADLHVSHGVAYIRGTLKGMPGCADDLQTELDHIVHVLKCRPEFRDVIVEARIPA